MCCSRSSSSPWRPGFALACWFLAVAVVGIGASLLVSFLFLEEQYVTESDDSPWLLVGGVTSTSASFRIHLPKEYDRDGQTRKRRRLVVWRDQNAASSGEPIPGAEYSLEEGGSGIGSNGTASSSSSSSSRSLDVYLEQYDVSAITATNLEPRANYLYGVLTSSNNDGNDASWILRGRFRTPPPENTRFDFTVAASGMAWTGSKAAVFDVIRNDHPDVQFMVHLGGFHSDADATFSFQEQLDNMGKVMKSGQPQADLYSTVPVVYAYQDDEWDYQTISTDEPYGYNAAFPRYPPSTMAGSEQQVVIGGEATLSNENPHYHAFTIGSVRFIVATFSSLRSSTNQQQQQQQLDWFKAEVEQAERYDFVVWITSFDVNEDGEANNNDVQQQVYEFISQVIGGDEDAAGPQNLLALSANDAPMMAFDDGTQNKYYFSGTGTSAQQGNTSATLYSSFPMLHAAPLDRMGEPGNRAYSEGCWGFDQERTHQYSILSFEFPQQQQEQSNESGNIATQQEENQGCIQIKSYSVDPWYTDSKRTLFTRRLCGKFFQPSIISSVSDPRPPSTCSIDEASTITLSLFSVGVALCAILGGGVCLLMMRQNNESGESHCMMNFCQILTCIVVAWLAYVISVAMGIVVPLLAEDIDQYDLRPTFLVGMGQTALMLILLIMACFCCRGTKRGADAGTSDNEDSIICPTVIRQQTNIKVSESELPQGVILTGGAKLREDNLTGKNVRVAVIDSGIDEKHPGFKGKVTRKKWYRYGTPLSSDDHGTHVAGTVHLMAPEAEIYDYRVFGRRGNISVTEAVAQAITDASNAGCQVINMSLGGPFPSPQIQRAVQYAVTKGVIMVCAAGNEGDNNPLTNEVSYPASYEETISVAAVSKQDGFPVAVFSNSNPQVDYAGIGVDVTSFKPGGGFQIMSGTSMASPHLAGLIACLLSGDNEKTSTIPKRLNELAVDIDAVGPDNATGVGFVTYLDKSTFDQMFRSERLANDAHSVSVY